MFRLAVGLALILAVYAMLSACGQEQPDEEQGSGGASGEAAGEESSGADEGSFVVYSGREEALVGPIIEQFADESGVEAQVRYGDTAELAATVLEEGENSPADVFFAQDPGALGALTDEGRFRELPRATLDKVPERFRSPDGLWVGASGRARVIAYNTENLTEEDLPSSIFGFTDPEWSGRIGWAPTNGSFQAFVTALREIEGDDRAREWLEGIQANEPLVYPDNLTALEGVAAGEVDVAFVNHYYLYRALEEQGEGFGARNYYLGNGDPGALVLAAGAGVMNTTDDPEVSEEFVDYLLSQEAQQYFADQTYEYPMVAGVEAEEDLLPLSEIESPDVDLTDLDDLQGTLEMLQETGAL